MRFLFLVQCCPATIVKPTIILCFKVGRVSVESYFSWCIFLQAFTKDSWEDIEILNSWIRWESLIQICFYQVMIDLTDILVFFVMCNLTANFLFHWYCNHIAQKLNMSQVIRSQESVCYVLSVHQFVDDNVVQQRRSRSQNPCGLLCVGWMQIVWCESWIHVHFVRGRQIVDIEIPFDCDFRIFCYLLSIAIFNDSKNLFVCFLRDLWKKLQLCDSFIFW